MATKRYRSLVTGACTPAGRILVEGLSANGHFVVATDSPEAFGADDGRLADAARAVRDVAEYGCASGSGNAWDDGSAVGWC